MEQWTCPTCKAVVKAEIWEEMGALAKKHKEEEKLDGRAYSLC